MSANGEGGGREIAYRMFAAEYDDSTLSHTESDEERAPNYVVTPTGARVNRLFVVGALTEVTQVNEEMVRARVVDPTGAFVVYAGQYQPDELAYLERADPPCFVAVTGKARTFQPEDGDRIYTSVRPESIATVDADTRDRWIVNAAEQTIDRIGAYASATEIDARGEDLTDSLLEAGLEDGLAHGIPLAQDHYGTTPSYLEGLRDLALEATRVVAGEREQVEAFDRQPDDTRPDAPTFSELATAGDLEVPTPDGVSKAEADAVEVTSSSTGTVDGTQSAVVTEPSDEPAGEDQLESTTEDSTLEDADTDTDPVDDFESTDDTDPLEAEIGDEPSLESVDEPATDADSTTDIESDSADLGDVPSQDIDAPETDLEVDETDDDLGDFEAGDGMYEMDEEEREQIEEQFGAEFTTGAEVDEPGEAGIDVPDPDDLEDEPETGGLESEPETGGVEPEASDSLEAEPSEEPADDGDDVPEDIDLQSVAIEIMSDLDDGSGANREDVVEAVVAETGADAEAVEEAIQDALMGGQCYEPDEETLKAI